MSEAEFREYDKDGSGEIDEEEFKALVRDKGWIFQVRGHPILRTSGPYPLSSLCADHELCGP